MKHFKPVHDPTQHLTTWFKTAHNKDTELIHFKSCPNTKNTSNYFILNTQPLRLQTEPHFQALFKTVHQ